MNIIFGILSYDGGAPYSVLQYCKCLKSNNHNVCMIGEPANEKVIENCQNSGIEVLKSGYLNEALVRHNIFRAFKIFKSLYKTAENFKPDLIIAAGHRHFYNTVAKLLGIPCIFMVCGGNLSEHDFEAKLWKPEYSICFSIENKTDLLKFGYPEERVSLISNRIDAKLNEKYIDFYSEKAQKVKILFVSRLANNKLNSAVYTVNLVDWLNENGIYATLKIAGDGDGLKRVKELSDKVNKKHNRKIIELLGFVADVNSLIDDVHFMFGKGRSILEPMIKGKLGVVVGENEEMSLCTLSSFNNLYEHNFAGREMKCSTSKEEFAIIAKQILNGEFDCKQVKQISELVASHYSSEGLDNKFLPIIDKYKGREKNCSAKHYKFKLFYEILNYEFKKATAKIKRNFR